MEGSGKKAKIVLKKARNTVLPLFVGGIFAGALSGAIVCLFNMGAAYLTSSSEEIYAAVREHPYYVPLFFAVLALLALFTALVHSRVPEVRGSGVPQTEGVMRGLFSFRKIKVFFCTLILSYISFFSGLPLGAEGPSVQLGAVTADGAAHALKMRLCLHRYLISAGAGAGLAVAFNAPLTGIVFVMEEGHKKFSCAMLFVCALAVSAAVLVYRALNFAVFGTFSAHAFFDLSGVSVDAGDVNVYLMMLPLAVFIGIAALFFNKLLLNLQKFTDKRAKRFPYLLRLVIAFFAVGAVGLIPAVSGAVYGGGTLIDSLLSDVDSAWYMLLAILIVKIALIALCYNAGATGGLFVPMLALGALIGALTGKMLLAAGLNGEYYPLLVCAGMTAFFAASVGTPVTAAVLIVEGSGWAFDMLPALIAIFGAYALVRLCGGRPIYDCMLERHLRINGLEKTGAVHRIEFEVERGSFADGRQIGDILWQPGCAVSAIERDNAFILPESGLRLKGGDRLLLQLHTDDMASACEYVRGIVKCL